MGLYNTIIMEYPINGEDWSGKKFQTKGLINDLSIFKITKEGELFNLFSNEEWDYENKEFWGKYEFHGEFTVLHVDPSSKRYSRFILLFIKGKLKNVIKMEDIN